MFSYFKDSWWNPRKDRFETIESYLPLPYDYALTFVRSYEEAF